MDIIHYDENGTREESKPVILEVNLTEQTRLALPAKIDIKPDKINLKSKEDWVTAYIELPAGYGVENLKRKPYRIEKERDGRLTGDQRVILDNLMTEIEGTVATIDLEIESDDEEVEMEVDGYLSERGHTLLDELVKSLKHEGNDVKIEIEKEIDWGNYRGDKDDKRGEREPREVHDRFDDEDDEHEWRMCRRINSLKENERIEIKYLMHQLEKVNPGFYEAKVAVKATTLDSSSSISKTTSLLEVIKNKTLSKVVRSDESGEIDA